MKVLVTGGSGFLGINVVRYLLKKGCEVVSLDIAPFEYPEKDQIEAVVGDIRDTECLKRVSAGVSIVVHSAAALPMYTREDIYSTDVAGTRNVLDAAFAAGAERVVFISTTAVYGFPERHPLYETDKLENVGPYSDAKIEAEKVCEEFRRVGKCVPILRPKSFIGPERLGVFSLLFDWAATGHGFPVIGSGNNRYQLLDVEDFCDAIWAAMTLLPVDVNDTFNIGAKEYATMREDWQVVLDRAGYDKRVVSLPKGLTVFALRVLEALRLSPVYEWVYNTALTDSFVSIEKAEQKLQFKPKYSNKDALLRNFEWYLAHRHEFEGASGVSHRVPWKQGLLGVAKFFF